MKKNEFLREIQRFQGRLDGWEIVTDRFSETEYILGCYYDEEEHTWKVYKNAERGMQSIRLSTPNEDLAFNKLFSMVEFVYKIVNR